MSLIFCTGVQCWPGPVVGVLTAGLQVEIIEPPVLQLLAEVLNTNLQQSCSRLNTLPPIFVSGIYPLGEMQLVCPIKAKDGVKVPGRSVEVVFSLGQGVGVTELVQSCNTTISDSLNNKLDPFLADCYEMVFYQCHLNALLNFLPFDPNRLFWKAFILNIKQTVVRYIFLSCYKTSSRDIWIFYKINYHSYKNCIGLILTFSSSKKNVVYEKEKS